MLKPASRYAGPILEGLSALPELRLAILFGSLAQGSETAESDIDLALDAGHPLGAEEKMALMESLAQSTGRPVDLVDLRVAGEPLMGQVLRHGVLIHGKTSDYASLLSRYLIDQADFAPYRNRILSERRRAWIGK